MRTTKELLELMLENQCLFCTGVCFWAKRLFLDNLITREEFATLNRYIDSQRPIDIQWWKYWLGECGEIQPRLEWIKQHIELNS